MATNRRQILLLVALLAVLAFVGIRALGPASMFSTTAAERPTSRSPSASAAQGPRTSNRLAAHAGRGTAQDATPDVRLESLGAERPKPGSTDRNLFRFKPKAPPPPPPGAFRPPPPPVTAPPVPMQPAGPPPPPPITLKFIGLLTPESGGMKIAVLTDGMGPPMQVREGEIVAGRYRVLRIGVESIEMAYLDGRGRQTIRLTGS